MQNIQAWAYVAIALDILFGIMIFVQVWRKTNMQKIFNERKDEYGPWMFFYYLIKIGPIKCFPGFGKIHFIIFEVIFKFGLPMIDTFSGKCLNQIDVMRAHGQIYTPIYLLCITLYWLGLYLKERPATEQPGREFYDYPINKLYTLITRYYLVNIWWQSCSSKVPECQ